MKKVLSIAVVALMMAGSMAFACETCGCQDKKAESKSECTSCKKPACCTAEKKCDKCTAEKPCDSCVKKAKKAKEAAEAKKAEDSAE